MYMAVSCGHKGGCCRWQVCFKNQLLNKCSYGSLLFRHHPVVLPGESRFCPQDFLWVRDLLLVAFFKEIALDAANLLFFIHEIIPIHESGIFPNLRVTREHKKHRVLWKAPCQWKQCWPRWRDPPIFFCSNEVMKRIYILVKGEFWHQWKKVGIFRKNPAFK